MTCSAAKLRGTATSATRCRSSAPSVSKTGTRASSSTAAWASDAMTALDITRAARRTRARVVAQRTGVRSCLVPARAMDIAPSPRPASASVRAAPGRRASPSRPPATVRRVGGQGARARPAARLAAAVGDGQRLRHPRPPGHRRHPRLDAGQRRPRRRGCTMRFQLQYFKRRRTSAGTTSARRATAAASRSARSKYRARQTGRNFTVRPPGSRRLPAPRRRDLRVAPRRQARAARARAHAQRPPGTAGADPTDFSAATCTVRKMTTAAAASRPDAYGADRLRPGYDRSALRLGQRLRSANRRGSFVMTPVTPAAPRAPRCARRRRPSTRRARRRQRRSPRRSAA